MIESVTYIHMHRQIIACPRKSLAQDVRASENKTGCDFRRTHAQERGGGRGRARVLCFLDQCRPRPKPCSRGASDSSSSQKQPATPPRDRPSARLAIRAATPPPAHASRRPAWREARGGERVNARGARPTDHDPVPATQTKRSSSFFSLRRPVERPGEQQKIGPPFWQRPDLYKRAPPPRDDPPPNQNRAPHWLAPHRSARPRR